MQKNIEIHLPHYEIPQLSLRYRPLSSLPLQKVRIKKDEPNLMLKYLKFLTCPQLGTLLPGLQVVVLRGRTLSPKKIWTICGFLSYIFPIFRRA